MLSATTQDRSDSMAARMAMVMPFGSWSRSRSTLSWGMWSAGLAREHVEVADGARLHPEAAHHGDARGERHERSGDALAHLGPEEQDGEAHRANGDGLPIRRADALGDGVQLVHGLDGRCAGGVGEAEEVFQLSDDEGDRDTRSEAGGDGVGHESDDRTQLEQAHQNEQNAGDDGGRDQTVDAVGGHDARHDGGEGGGGPRDLHAAAAEEGDEEPGDDGRVETLLGAHARGDGERDGEGERNHGHHDAREDVLGSCRLSSSALECLTMLNSMGLILSRCNVILLRWSAPPGARKSVPSRWKARTERERTLCGWVR